MNITKDNVTALIGTAEGFSADAVKKQLAVRQEAVAAQLKRFRTFHELTKSKR